MPRDILLVEHYGPRRHATHAILEQDGRFHVHGVRSFAAARNFDLSNFSCAVVEFTAPLRGALRFVRELARRHALPVLALIPKSELVSASLALRAGAGDFLFEDEAFANTLRRRVARLIRRRPAQPLAAASLHPDAAPASTPARRPSKSSARAGRIPPSPHGDAGLNAILDASPLAIFTTDRQGVIVLWNASAERIFGWKREEAVGRFIPTIPREHLAEFNKHLESALQGIPFAAAPLRRLRKGNAMIDISLWGGPITAPAGGIVGVIAVAEDVTQANQARQQMIQSQRMESVGRLAGGVAHDFNNLLAVISGYSESLLRRMSAADPLVAQVREIERAAERGGALTRQLLAFSRRQVIAPQRVNLNRVIQGVRELVGRVVNPRVEVILSLEPRLGEILADPGQMEQILVNLAINASDAMPAGGNLTISTANIPAEESAAPMAAENAVRLSVADTGVGMDAETRLRVFEPFFTTKEGKGTGLGLSIVFGIVQQAGGHILIDSEPGRGARFDILFRRAADPR